jgi:hypothetical protein
MAVLVEAISVVVRADALLQAFHQDWAAFVRSVPNKTMCADGELVRVGFMVPADVEQYVTALGTRGLVYVDRGAAKDLVVVDQLRGPACPCRWAEFGNIELDGDPQRRVAACRLKGSTSHTLMKPEGWQFEGSLSQTYGFVPTQQADRGLRFLRSEDQLDVYFNELTGKEVYVGRTARR